ncbi:uncharacterized protein SPSC_04979 [Sporisorium scitamineum]|uniref:Uncharacterized protein n=2 Tax=Sporisorium scitamineum TaxID=49012 RepID=A0A127ZGH4_9BASI|nr:uncharacterized protein SPSC_04979 [Sporisorium scitamineum]
MTDTPPTPSTSAAPTITPTKAAQLRLDTLSFLIHGATPSTPTTAPALLRLSQIISTLTALSSSDSANKPISRLLDDWDDYADLLSPLPLPEGDKEVWDAQQQASYLLSQQVELQQALQALDGIQRLVEERKVLDADLSRKLTRRFKPPSPF